ncbi:hypothetical protein DW322_17120 [Rhodococcus rhodnii]|uniref:Uncharacterized protein n=1 Tax=Rhodococcus rhodnii TaxID=38312 RepID=A0A6P2CGT9_9NOCA|nr:hypothetical protein DW322_17120 [Rhodococcus rhodnii]
MELPAVAIALDVMLVVAATVTAVVALDAPALAAVAVAFVVGGALVGMHASRVLPSPAQRPDVAPRTAA